MPLTAYSYIRWSHPQQRLGRSRERQLESTKAFCLKHHWHLDTSLKLIDEGKSAFSEANLKAGGKLRLFLDKVESGDIHAPAVLVIESLDRLSRTTITKAVNLLTSILLSGIGIATTSPEDYVTKEILDKEPHRIYAIAAVLHRASDESTLKSKRIQEVKDAKLAIARETGVKLTKSCPCWLTLSPDRTTFIVDQKKLQTINLIFSLSNDLGEWAITKHLNQNYIQHLTGRTVWTRSSVTHILFNRALLGEYQPRSGKHGKDKGDVIKDYYPQVLPLPVWHKSHLAIQRRSQQPTGKIGDDVPNLFQGIITHATDGCNMTLVTKRDTRRLVSRNATHGYTQYVSYDYSHFEFGFLAFLHGVTSDDVQPQQTKQTNQLTVLRGELSETQSKIAQLSTELERTSDFTAGLNLLAKLDTRKKELERKLQTLTIDSHRETPQHNLHQSQSVNALLAITTKPDERYRLRLRLKSLLRELVDKIVVTIWDTELPDEKLHRKATPTKKARVLKAVITFDNGITRILWFVTLGFTRPVRHVFGATLSDRTRDALDRTPQDNELELLTMWDLYRNKKRTTHTKITDYSIVSAWQSQQLDTSNAKILPLQKKS